MADYPLLIGIYIPLIASFLVSLIIHTKMKILFKSCISNDGQFKFHQIILSIIFTVFFLYGGAKLRCYLSVKELFKYSWHRISELESTPKEIDEIQNRMSLSIKALEKYPGENIEKLEQVMANAEERWEAAQNPVPEEAPPKQTPPKETAPKAEVAEPEQQQEASELKVEGTETKPESE